MSCNGCRILRKGCSESCVLRPCLQWIQSPESQGNATVFVAKFFGRAGLMSFITAVPESQRPALFQSLLFEACGRTVNPVNGAVGLLWTGNWHVCQAAVETVLNGGTLVPIPDLLLADESSEADLTMSNSRSNVSINKRKRFDSTKRQPSDLDLRLTPNFASKNLVRKPEMLRPATPSMNSEESVTTVSFDGDRFANAGDGKELNLFV